MIKNYIFGAHAVILCYDITNSESFENLEDWYRKVKQSFTTKDGVETELPLCVLLGNKIDLDHLRAVKESKSSRFAVENKFLSFRVSAKSGDKVKLSFTQVAAR